MLRKVIVLLGCLSIAFTGVHAQTQSCAQTLRLARSTYDQGRLHELPGLLEKCLAGGFTQADKVTALRLLTLSYIYLEEPEKADESMRQLLETDHFFQINEAVDPAEFVALYKTFRTTPIYSFGGKIGPTGTFASVLKNYSVGNQSPGNGKYGLRVGFQFGASFEKELFAKSKSVFLKRTIFAPEIYYTIRSLTYKNDNVFSYDSLGDVSAATSEITYKQTWIDFNMVFFYKLKDDTDLNNRDKLIPYVGIGPGISLLIKGSNTQTFIPIEGSTVSGPDVDITSSYNKLAYSVIGVAGARIRFGSFYVTGEVRYQHGLSNVINPAKRTNAESVFDYATQLNDFKQSNATFNLGIVFPIFKPKKN